MLKKFWACARSLATRAYQAIAKGLDQLNDVPLAVVASPATVAAGVGGSALVVGLQQLMSGEFANALKCAAYVPVFFSAAAGILTLPLIAQKLPESTQRVLRCVRFWRPKDHRP